MGKTKAKVEAGVTPLQEIVNVPEQVSAFGRTYLIQKFTFGPMTQALEYIGPMGYLLQWLEEMPRDKKGNIIASSDQIMAVLVKSVSILGPSVFGIVSIATQEPIEWLEKQDAIEGLRLFAKVVEKNLDFFSRKNLEELTSLINGLTQAIPRLGGDT